jgi:transcriptional regulator with XRE-family HTH domain
MPSFERPMAGRITDNADIGQEYRRRIGRYISNLRHKQEMTGRELGDLVGIGVTAVSAIETGRNPLPPERYEDFAKALNVSREEFARFMLEHTNPWLYAMLFTNRKAQVLNKITEIPDRLMDLRAAR